MFITMPKVFASLPGGEIIGLVFFVFVIFAALTSSIAIMEAVVYSVMERFGMGRIKSCLIVFIVMIPLGLLSVFGHGKWSEVTIMGMQFMDFFDYVISSVLIPMLALFTCILIGHVAKISYVEEEVRVSAERFNMKKIYCLMIRFLCPVALLMMLAAFFI